MAFVSPISCRAVMRCLVLLCCVVLCPHRSTMSQAGESDGKVIQRLNDNEGAFARLTPDAVASQLPRLQVRCIVLCCSAVVLCCSTCMHGSRLTQSPASCRGCSCVVCCAVVLACTANGTVYSLLTTAVRCARDASCQGCGYTAAMLCYPVGSLVPGARV
jgi:hypothetical protein